MTHGADDAWSQSPEEDDRDLSDNDEPRGTIETVHLCSVCKAPIEVDPTYDRRVDDPLYCEPCHDEVYP